jgi:23S rRNA maturation mini-RNase III
MTTLTNTFHNTEVTVRDSARTTRILQAFHAELTAAEKAHARRVRNALCGVEGCTCGVIREERQ